MFVTVVTISALAVRRFRPVAVGGREISQRFRWAGASPSCSGLCRACGGGALASLYGARSFLGWMATSRRTGRGRGCGDLQARREARAPRPQVDEPMDSRWRVLRGRRRRVGAAVSPRPTGCGRPPWRSRLVGCLFAGAHPGGDPRDETEHECGDAVLGVVVTAAGLVPGEEGGQLVSGLGEVEH